MQTAKVFQNGRSQAIRLPKEFRVDTDEVYLKKDARWISGHLARSVGNFL